MSATIEDQPTQYDKPAKSNKKLTKLYELLSQLQELQAEYYRIKEGKP